MVFERLSTLGFEEGHAMLSLWHSIASEHGVPPPVQVNRYAYYRKEVNSGTLVLLNWTQNFFRVDLDRLLETGASVVAFLEDGRTLSPNVVIDSVPGLLRDCCCSEAFNEHLFRERLDHVLAGRNPYAPFTLASPHETRITTNPHSVFVATPLDEDLYRPFYQGTSAAMSKLGMRIRNPGRQPGTSTINHKVLEDIDACDIVIANLRQKRTKEERGYNANVWYEIGYAWKADKPVLLFRHVSDWLSRPSDVQASEIHTYCNAIDLALQLFYGFGGHAVRDLP